MEVSQLDLLYMILACLLLGAALGAVYDVFRLLRRAADTVRGGEVPSYARSWKLPFLGCPGDRKHGNALSHGVTVFVTVFCDVLFGLIAGISVLLLLYDRNDGIFRLSAPAGVAVGFSLYRISLGRLIAAFEDAILFFAGILARYLFLIILLPFRLLFCGLRALYRLTLAPILTRLCEKQKKAVSDHRIALLLRGAETAYFGEKDIEKEG